MKAESESMEFNNREIATFIWMGAIAVFCAFFPNMRTAFWGLAKSFFKKFIILTLTIAALWIAGCVWVLQRIGIWQWDNLKTTIIWAVTFAFVTMFSVTRITEDKTFFKETVKETIGLTAIITFVVTLYTFGFVTELLLVPAMTFIALLQAVAATKPEYKTVNNVLTTFLTVIGLAYLGYSFYQVFHKFDEFATWQNLREFIVPIALSFLFLPFIYAMGTYIVYETRFLHLNWALEDKKLRRFAKWQAIIHFGFNVERLRRWTRDIGVSHPATRLEIKKSIAELRGRIEREKVPPKIDPEEGWSPYAAKDFLIAAGLSTKDYHPSYETEWIANSNMVTIEGTGILGDNIAYYVEGDEHAAKRLKLRLHVNNSPESDETRDRFQGATLLLLDKAVGPVSDQLRNDIARYSEVNEIVEKRRIFLEKEDFISARKGFTVTLSIDYDANYAPPFG